MNLTDSDTLKFLKGSPILLDDVCAIHSVKLGEIVDIGYDNFLQYLGVLTAEKPIPKRDEDPELVAMLNELTDFQYLLLSASADVQVNRIMKNAFRFFTHSEATFSFNPAQIILGPIEEKHLLTESKFHDFQHVLRRMYYLDQEGDEIVINENDSEAVKRMKMQMRANREKVRRAKAKKAAQEKSDMKFSDLVASITINNCGLNMENVWNITYYAFHDQLKRMGWRDQFNINNSAALAGAKLQKSQLKHWMRSIADSDKS